MAEDRIRVRLVPKPITGLAIAELGAVTPKTAREYRPDHGRAELARRIGFSMGLESSLSPRDRVDVLVPREMMERILGVSLVSKTGPGGASDRATGTREFLSPDRELTVPEELRDTIAFAYMATPPRFFAVTPIAPKVSVHHLTLDGVVGALRAGKCHRRGWTGRAIRVAMTDSGFANHPYFDERGYTIERVGTFGATAPMIDTEGHGTGHSANALCVAPDATFVGVKHEDMSALALETAQAQSPNVITNSWGWDVDVQSREALKTGNPNLFNEFLDLENVITDAISDGITVVFAAGNGHRAFPASMPSVLAVGGVTVNPDGSLKASSYASSFSSFLYVGRNVPDVCGIVGELSNAQAMRGHIALPVPPGSVYEGTNLPASKGDKGWGIFSGTSAAAPQVAGAVALMISAAKLERNRTLTPDAIRAFLAASCRDVTAGTTALGDVAATGIDLATGAGLIDAFEACQMASAP